MSKIRLDIRSWLAAVSVRHSCNKLELQAGAHLALVALVGVTLHRATKGALANLYLL